MTEPVKDRIVILIADDDRDILDLVVFKLNQAGFDTVAVTDGEAALAAIEANPPRLAILDIMMPGMSGLEVLQKVRANEAISDLDVILLTARARDTDVDAGYASGASDYVIKPFSPRELLVCVNAVLARGDR
jgi:DNA-binding response OmpR family regulator